MTTPDRPDRGHTPEMAALVEVIKLWLPGIKAEPAVVAERMRLNLLKRGVALVPAAQSAAHDDLVAALLLALDKAESYIASEYEGTASFAPMMAELEPCRAALAKIDTALSGVDADGRVG